MNFSDAMSVIRQSGRCRRPQWAPNSFICLGRIEALNVAGQQADFVFMWIDHRVSFYNPLHEDYWAEDWERVEAPVEIKQALTSTHSGH